MDLLSNQPPSGSLSASKGILSFQQYRSKVKERTISSMLPLRFVQNPNPKDLSSNSNWCSIDNKRQLLSSRTSHSSTINVVQSNQTTPINVPSPSFITDRQINDATTNTPRKKTSIQLQSSAGSIVKYPSSSQQQARQIFHSRTSSLQQVAMSNEYYQNSLPPTSSRLLHTSLRQSAVNSPCSQSSISKKKQALSARTNQLISNLATTNALFNEQDQLLRSTQNLSENVKQTLMALSLNNAQKKADENNTNGILSQDVKVLMFSTLDKLEKLILEKGRTNFYDRLIPESIELLNSLIPTVIRQLADFDCDLSKICEGLYSFVLIFLDQIQQRIQSKIKKEYSQKLNDNETLINDQKTKIAALQKDLVAQKLRNVQDRISASAAEGKLKAEIERLNSQLSDLKGTLNEFETTLNENNHY